MCGDIIRKAAGVGPLLDLEVKEVREWTMTAQVADRFTAADHRLILVGDAAHRFPPAGGFGMNSGIQDTHNLAWKVAAVLGGRAPLALIRSYEAERRQVRGGGSRLMPLDSHHLLWQCQVALANTALSVANYKAAMAVPSALGLDPRAARALHLGVNSPPLSLLPLPAQRSILEAGMAVGRRQVGEAFLSAWNPLGALRLAAVERIVEGGESLQLQFPAEDLGVRYGGPAPPQDGRRRAYVPIAQPGGRLPHCEFTPLGAVSKRSKVRDPMGELAGGGRHCRIGRRFLSFSMVVWRAVVGGVDLQSGPVSVPLPRLHPHCGTVRGRKAVGRSHGNCMPRITAGWTGGSCASTSTRWSDWKPTQP